MPTQQFKWIDRDTAARDMLQLVYHAPPQIAEQAVKLLKAIRSPAIIPDLRYGFLDVEYDIQLRREMYEVICAIPGNYDFSEFATVISEVFEEYNFYSYAIRLLKHHPTNISWILLDIEVKELSAKLHIYSNILEYLPEIATEPILKILSENENLLDEPMTFRLHKYGGEAIQNWLYKHWDQIIHLWLTDNLSEEAGKYWKRLLELSYGSKRLDTWPEFKQALSELTPNEVLKFVGDENNIRRRLIYIRLLPHSPKTGSKLLIRAVEEKQIFLDLEVAGLLHQYGDERVQSWLQQRWDELIYVCLIDSVGTAHHAEKMRIVHILEKWPELKTALFRNSPTIIEEYNQKKETCNIESLVPVADADIQATSVWQALEQSRKNDIEPNKTASQLGMFSAWENLMARSEDDIPKAAAEVYFLGKISEMDWRTTSRLTQLFEEAGETWRTREFLYIWDEHVTFSHLPIRFEAAYALRNQATERIWTSFIQLFFIRSNVYGAIAMDYSEDHMLRWISRMTDMLSGVEPELPDEELPLNARPWFCALVKQNPS